MARWLQSFRRPPTAGAVGRTNTPAPGTGVSSRLTALRSTVAGIGTTLDEQTTCGELTKVAAGHTGCTAAIVRRASEEGEVEFEAVSGDHTLLPDLRWAAEVACRADSRVGHERYGPALCVPLATGEDRYGVLVCVRRHGPFTPSEVDMLALLAERAASHIRHAREHDRMSRIVGDLQRALLAEPGRPHPNLDVAIRYLPVGQRALVGGDWCETVRLHFGRTLLVVGDVMGHGLEAAVDMTAYRSALRYIASSDLPPHRVLRQLDDIASSESERRPATCLIARVDPVRGQVTLASAGHLPAAVIDGKGDTSLLPVPVGPPLGTGLGGYEPATYHLEADETLLLFTDGLVEHRGEDIDESLNRLARLRFTASEGVETILDTVLANLDARHAEDDVAVLASRLRHRPQPGDEGAALGM
ncbi:PP2C family protein-serine/threonine phosphatase [Streptomyces spinoverrucosus]|uniref:PP2C family protein-serine/threonine phosphatase n=1 Tax=Streptomyces spinoverrucosus TaxID=284043 RepID=UPI0027DA0060|nr:SpoIIE family protein phosphatase [Streptomyces spinoverrucosus]